MPRDSARAPQFPLLVHDPAASPDALARYEAIRPVLKSERSLRQQSQRTGMNYWRLWRDLRRFRREGLLGLIDRRTLPHARGKPAVQELLPRPIQQHIVRLAIAHPFTARELARIVREGYRYPVDHRGIQGGSLNITSPLRRCRVIVTEPVRRPLRLGRLGTSSACPSSRPFTHSAWSRPWALSTC